MRQTRLVLMTRPHIKSIDLWEADTLKTAYAATPIGSRLPH